MRINFLVKELLKSSKDETSREYKLFTAFGLIAENYKYSNIVEGQVPLDCNQLYSIIKDLPQDIKDTTKHYINAYEALLKLYTTDMDLETKLMANNVYEGITWLYEELARRVYSPEIESRSIVASNRAESFLSHLKDDKCIYVQSIVNAAKHCERFLED